MSLWDSLQKLLPSTARDSAGRGIRSDGPRLARGLSGAIEVGTDHLEVRTAEGLVILVTDVAGAAVLASVAAAGEPATVFSLNERVQLVPSTETRLPVHDPKSGWVIALDPELATALAGITSPGSYECSPAVAVVVEEAVE